MTGYCQLLEPGAISEDQLSVFIDLGHVTSDWHTKVPGNTVPACKSGKLHSASLPLIKASLS